MSPETRVRQNPRIVAQRLAGDNGAVLLHLDTNAYHSLNGTGVLIWELLNQPSTVSDLTDRLRAELDDNVATIQDDMLLFVRSMVERQLMLIVDPDVDGAVAGNGRYRGLDGAAS